MKRKTKPRLVVKYVRQTRGFSVEHVPTDQIISILKDGILESKRTGAKSITISTELAGTINDRLWTMTRLMSKLYHRTIIAEKRRKR
jgi:hypothetical protein